MGRLGVMFRLVQDQSGNVLIITGIVMPVLVGMAGLATDTVQWSLWKRELQRQADSAAIAGASAKAEGASVTDAATVEIDRHSFATLTSAPIIENAPTSGSYAGNNNAVRVVLQTTQRLPFSGMFMSAAPTTHSEATAAVVANGNYCVISLESSTNAGITMQGNASVNMGCGMATNSQAANAVVAGGSSSIYATPIAAVGGLSASSNYSTGTQLLPYSLTQPDPFANLPQPILPSCSGQLNVAPSQTRTVSNPTGVACYRGMDLKGTVNFDPGIYYIDGGSLSFGSQTVVAGAGVTFILTSSSADTNPSSIATVNMNGGATVNLTPPTSGTYSGILFYQDRRALDSGTNTINGNASSHMEGGFYFPSQAMSFSGDSGMDTSCIQLVSKRVTFIGNNHIANNCPAGPGPHSFTGAQVRLVA